MRTASRIVLCLSLCLATISARAQSAPAPGPCLGAPCGTGEAPSPTPAHGPRPPYRVARGAAIFGLVSAALTLSGAIALGKLDSARDERVGRGALLGLTVISGPIIAISSLVSRRRARVNGSLAARTLGWIAYSGAVINDAFFLYRALNDNQPSLGFSIAAGALSAVGVLSQAFDAYLVSRQSRSVVFSFYVSPRGGNLRLRF